MNNSHPTIEDRLNAYRWPLDEALDRNPAPTSSTERRDILDGANVIEIHDVEQQRTGMVSDWRRYALVAASIATIVGAGLLLVGRTDPSTRVSSSALDDTVPVACPPQVGGADIGEPAPDLDFDHPDFLVTLPVGTPPRELVIRALLNPVAGTRCIAYDPDTITTSLDHSDQTATATVKPPASGREFNARLTIMQTADAIGVTRIDGSTLFSIDQSNPIATLDLSGDLPAAAADIVVRFRRGADVIDITAPVADARAIPLQAADGSAEADGDLSWVTYVIRDHTGLPLDTGGSLVP